MPGVLFFLLILKLMRIVIRTGFTTAAFGNSLGAFHHQFAAHWAESTRRFGLDRVLAVRIIGAAIEDPEAATAFHHFSIFAIGTFDAGFFLGEFFFVFLDEFALRIARARNEYAEAAFTLDEFTAAFC